MQRKVFPILFATLLLDMIGIGMVFPIIPIIFTDPTSPSFLLTGHSQGEQFLIAGVITALFGLMQFVAAPILGELSDIYGRKRLLTLGVGVLAASQLLFGLGIEIKSLMLLFVSRAVAGFAGANFSIAQAAIADITEPKDRAKNFGLIGAAFGIGFILGPLLGGIIAQGFNNAAAPFWFAGLLGILNIIFISLMLPETRKNLGISRKFHILKGLQNIKAAFSDVDARPIYLASFLYMSGFSFLTTFMGILLVSQFGFTEAGIGTFFGIVGACVVVTQVFILRILASKYTEREILRWTLILLAFAIASYPFIPSSSLVYFVIPFVAVPQGLSMANMGALVSKSVSPEKQGAALGINGSLLALSQGIIPLLAGVGSSKLGVQMPFFVGGIFVAVAWLTLFIFNSRR